MLDFILEFLVTVVCELNSSFNKNDFVHSKDFQMMRRNGSSFFL